MSNLVCTGPHCPDGNCVGCRNGQLWCGDPRCSPNCPNCPSNQNTWSVTVIIIIIIVALILIGLVIWIAWKNSHPAKIQPIAEVDANVGGSELKRSLTGTTYVQEPHSSNYKVNSSNYNVDSSNYNPTTPLAAVNVNRMNSSKQPVITISPPSTFTVSTNSNLIGGNLIF